MKNDPIVEEVHRVREAMWDAAGGDLNRLIETLRTSEREDGRKALTREQVEVLRRSHSRRNQPVQSGHGK